MLHLCIHPADSRRGGRTRRPALSRNRQNAPNKVGEPQQRILPVFLLRPKPLRLQDHDTVSGYAVVIEGKQPGLIDIGQRRSFDIESEVNACRYLIDVLPSGALGSDSRQLYLIIGYLDAIIDYDHTRRDAH